MSVQLTVAYNADRTISTIAGSTVQKYCEAILQGSELENTTDMAATISDVSETLNKQCPFTEDRLVTNPRTGKKMFQGRVDGKELAAMIRDSARAHPTESTDGGY